MAASWPVPGRGRAGAARSGCLGPVEQRRGAPSRPAPARNPPVPPARRARCPGLGEQGPVGHDNSTSTGTALRSLGLSPVRPGVGHQLAAAARVTGGDAGLGCVLQRGIARRRPARREQGAQPDHRFRCRSQGDAAVGLRLRRCAHVAGLVALERPSRCVSAATCPSPMASNRGPISCVDAMPIVAGQPAGLAGHQHRAPLGGTPLSQRAERRRQLGRQHACPAGESLRGRRRALQRQTHLAGIASSRPAAGTPAADLLGPLRVRESDGLDRLRGSDRCGHLLQQSAAGRCARNRRWPASASAPRATASRRTAVPSTSSIVESQDFADGLMSRDIADT